MRLIDADAVLYALVGEVHDNATKYGFRIGDIIKLTPTQVDEIVSRMPTIEERKRGKWIPQDFNKSDGMITTAVYYYPKCSVCGLSANNTNFCPNCGADMRGEKDG